MERITDHLVSRATDAVWQRFLSATQEYLSGLNWLGVALWLAGGLLLVAVAVRFIKMCCSRGGMAVLAAFVAAGLGWMWWNRGKAEGKDYGVLGSPPPMYSALKTTPDRPVAEVVDAPPLLPPSEELAGDMPLMGGMAGGPAGSFAFEAPPLPALAPITVATKPAASSSPAASPAASTPKPTSKPSTKPAPAARSQAPRTASTNRGIVRQPMGAGFNNFAQRQMTPTPPRQMTIRQQNAIASRMMDGMMNGMAQQNGFAPHPMGGFHPNMGHPAGGMMHHNTHR